ncbi:MAG TPA: cyclopropane-fatty-acyl-phospholipid synthase family protein [Hyphomicrobiales bacterium]|nr:cyclopropane-fatty-acyl-phospholipid synthase family protein [Hyphomicrobiales bacterium]
MSLRQRVLTHLKGRLGADPPLLRLAFWDGETFDFAPRPTVTITLTTPRVMRALLSGNFGRLGDAYVSGELAVDGAVEDILDVGIGLADRVGRSRLVARLGPLLRYVPRRHSKSRDAAAISHHYDVSNDFYRLWLDRNMVYSCGYFPTGEEGLDAAQEAKLDHICRKLRLKPGERLLDIGCGWGGLLHWAVTHYGVTGVGVTLSREQLDYAQAWIARDGLDGRIELRLQDYRDIEGEGGFDKVVSVGMYEHVGIVNQPTYFATLARLLKPGGIALNHGITVTDPDGKPQGPAGGEFIDRYVFPGGELPHLSRVIYEVAKAGLEAADVEDLRPHYARTLQHWVRRLEAHADAAIAAAGAERYRIWRIYMAGMAVAFDRGWLSIDQLVAYKPQADGRKAPRPWSRAHQYVACPDPPLANGLDWRTL